MRSALIRSLFAVPVALALLVGGTPAASATAPAAAAPAAAPAGVSAAVTKLSHAEAAAQLQSAGITWRSSGNCSDRNNGTCTSFTQVNQMSIQGAQTLKSASGCALMITGGTETGHADGTYSHWNGYKLDFAMSSCLTNYITGTFTSIGGSKWRAGSGNVYYNESNHWDVTFTSCGC